MALQVDTEGAYYNVNINILYTQIINIGLPTEFAYKVICLFLNKTQDKILGQRISNIMLPQDSTVSPILYIIYTFDLANSCNQSTVKILQFADDVCIYKSV